MSTVTTIGGEPARIDLDIAPGEPVDFTQTWTDANGDPQDFTGWTLLARAYPPDSDVPLHTFTTTAAVGGIQVSEDDTAGWADWTIPAARWTLWATSPAGQASLLISGWIRTR